MTITESLSNRFQGVWLELQSHREKQDATFHPQSSLYTIGRKLCQWQAIRRLQAMDDDSLQDIGIERYEIKEFVEKTCCQDGADG